MPCQRRKAGIGHSHSSTHAPATDIHGTLLSQRASLEGGSTKVGEMKGFAGDARRVLNSMARRAALHRLMLWVIIVLLSLSIAATLYRLLTNHGHII